MIITHDLGVLSSLTDKILIMYAGSEVESGPARELLSNPRHPYSQGLIAALPGASREGKFLTSIDGMPPELGNFPSGCAFHPRCGFAEDRCSVPPIDATVVSKGHRIYCPVNPFAHDRVEQS